MKRQTSDFKTHLAVFALSAFALIGCSHPRPAGESGPQGKVASIADGGAYIEEVRGGFEVGDDIVIYRRECKEIPVRGGPMRNCNSYEYGQGKIERRLEDNHLFIRSDAASIPVGASVKRAEAR